MPYLFSGNILKFTTTYFLYAAGITYTIKEGITALDAVNVINLASAVDVHNLALPTTCKALIHRTANYVIS